VVLQHDRAGGSFTQATRSAKGRIKFLIVINVHAIQQHGHFGVYAIYLPELFPTNLRSTGTSFCYNFGRFIAASAPFTIGQITRQLGNNIEGFRTAGMWVSIVLLAGILALPFLPETKDRPLPE